MFKNKKKTKKKQKKTSQNNEKRPKFTLNYQQPTQIVQKPSKMSKNCTKTVKKVEKQ